MQEISISTQISLSEITPKFIRILEQFTPFGPGNMRPVFMAEGIEVVNSPRIVGVNHIVSTLRQPGGDKMFDSIGFNLGSYYDLMSNGKLLDIVFTIEQINRDGRLYPQLRLKDIKPSEKDR